jgi:DNA-binding protein H-NS
MDRSTKLASMPLEELWEIHVRVTELLAAKLLVEKRELERRLEFLYTVADRGKTRRPYPPVHPKFENPDEPHQVWSGRGKRPRWVAEKLSSGLALEDLSITQS